jgi:hypothetical protein
MDEDHPNMRVYHLMWTDTQAPYVHPDTHRAGFRLDEAMRIAGFEPVTVVSETGDVVWVATRAVRAPAPLLARDDLPHGDLLF